MSAKSTLVRLAVVSALLASSSQSHALTPWTVGAPDLTVYVSGGAAQDSAFAEVVKNNLAQGDVTPGDSLDTFGDATTSTSANFGARWTVYYFTGKDGTAWAGQKVALVKRSYGAAGYGVVPVIAGLSIEELAIDALAAPATGNTTVYNEGGTTSRKYRVVVSSTNAASLLPLKASDAGITGVDAKLLLKPGTINYPGTVARVGTGSDVFPTNINAVPDTFTQVNTGGQVYGIAVTTDLYKVLQAAQKISGSLNPANIGDYTKEQDVPTLSRNFVASLLAGKIQTWEQVKVVAAASANGATAGTAYSLTDPVITTLAGVNLPAASTSQDFNGEHAVAVGVRNPGAAVGAVAYSVFLNHPFTAGSYAVPAATDAAFDASATPVVKRPSGTGATANLLDDWNQGANSSTLNTGSLKLWGLAINTADPNGSGAIGTNPEDAGKKHFRYVRIDGALPTIENVANGSYPHWAEGVLLYKTSLADTDPAKVALLTALANGLASPATASTVNKTLVHTWGQPGIFGLTANGETQTIPFDYNTPVVAYSHNSSGVAAQGEIVPTIYGPAAGVLLK